MRKWNNGLCLIISRRKERHTCSALESRELSSFLPSEQFSLDPEIHPTPPYCLNGSALYQEVIRLIEKTVSIKNVWITCVKYILHSLREFMSKGENTTCVATRMAIQEVISLSFYFNTFQMLFVTICKQCFPIENVCVTLYL